MEKIFGKIATFVSGTVFGLVACGAYLSWCDSEDDSFMLNYFPNARHRYSKDVERARAEERAKVNKVLKDTFNIGG